MNQKTQSHRSPIFMNLDFKLVVTSLFLLWSEFESNELTVFLLFYMTYQQVQKFRTSQHDKGLQKKKLL